MAPNPPPSLVLVERRQMTMFLHGFAIMCLFLGSLGLLAFATYLAWQEFKKLGT